MDRKGESGGNTTSQVGHFQNKVHKIKGQDFKIKPRKVQRYINHSKEFKSK